MDSKHERQRGLEIGRRWAERTCSHNLATVATASFDDVAALLPPDASDQFIGGFCEAVLRVWRGA
jgi:hypothetical protein